MFIDGFYVRYLSLIFVGFFCFCLILNLGIYIYIYIYICKLCFLLKKEGEEKADWEAMIECDIIFQFTPHHTIHVTAKTAPHSKHPHVRSSSVFFEVH